MINELIKEINQCLDNGCVMAGLTLALTLPDICGKALYSDTTKSSERYIKWYDEYIGQYEHTEEFIKLGIPYPSGDIIYSLRNSIIHEGNPNVDGDKFGIVYFELLYDQIEGSSVTTYLSESIIEEDDEGNEKATNKQITINVRDLCSKICHSADFCYKNNKDKFDFFNYNLVNIDFSARKTFGIKDANILGKKKD